MQSSATSSLSDQPLHTCFQKHETSFPVTKDHKHLWRPFAPTPCSKVTCHNYVENTHAQLQRRTSSGQNWHATYLHFFQHFKELCRLGETKKRKKEVKLKVNTLWQLQSDHLLHSLLPIRRVLTNEALNGLGPWCKKEDLLPLELPET